MTKTLQSPLLLLTIAFISSLSMTDIAWADKGTLDGAELWSGISEDIDEAPGYEDEQHSEREWALSIGLTSGFSPDYEGSNDYSFGYGPNISASWRDTIFFKGKTLGANLIRQKKLKAGLLLSKSSGRNQDSNDKLEGLGDVDGSVEAGGFMNYRMKPFRFRVEVRQDIGSGHEGALVIMSAGTKLPIEKPLVSLELSTTWASDDYMASFFGIDAQQSLDSGLKRYHADAGIKDVKISLTSGYAITNRWRIGSAIEYKRLVGDAADSPIVDDRNQFVAGISLSYHMGSKILPEDLQ